jgi:hypothetical protein
MLKQKANRLTILYQRFFHRIRQEPINCHNKMRKRVRNFRRWLAWDLLNVIMYNYRYIIMNGNQLHLF